MTDLCKHKAAAASINWFVGFLKGKNGTDRKETIEVLSKMLREMKTSNCGHCSANKDCRELDGAIKALSEKDARPQFSAGPAMVGPLVMRREHVRKSRLVRPTGR
ncbi:MAG: hypothetical protein WCO00_04845 [Rhodospirillaceae bacterium]